MTHTRWILLMTLTALALVGCHDEGARFKATSSGSQPASSADEAPPADPGPATPALAGPPRLAVRFSHFNPVSWDGAGTSVVLCTDQRARSVTINGRGLRKHGNLDGGREVWTDYDSPGLTGQVVVTLPQGVFAFIVQTTSGIVRGRC